MKLTLLLLFACSILSLALPASATDSCPQLRTQLASTDVATRTCQPRIAFRGRDLDRLAQPRQCLPSAFDAVVAHLPSSASRNARAVRQSRRTVRSLTPSICTISASSWPPK